MADPIAPKPDALRLSLYGLPRLDAGARSLALERKAAGALAWLSLRGPVLRSRLAELLWPTAPPEGARNNLRQVIFKLKRALDVAVIEGQETLQLAAMAQIVAGDAELLEGCTYDDCPTFAEWLSEARHAHRQRIAGERLRAADAALSTGDAEQALTLARALLAEDELSEVAHQRLVQALYLSGDRSAALEAAARCEALLRDALGVEPSPALQQLVDTVRRSGAPATVPVIPAAVLRPPRLIGRSRELGLIAQAGLEARVALVTGEPGLGKSRLLAEAAAATTGTRVLGARPGDVAVPFAALARWLRALHDAMPAPLDPLPPALQRLLPDRMPSSPAADRLDLQSAVIEILRRANAAGLTGLALDDLHFADDASLETLQALLDAPGLSALRWTLARRPAEGAAALARLADVLLDDDRLLPIKLAPLDEAGVRELVASLALPELNAGQLAPALWRSTGGNPMFVLETLKALIVAPQEARAADRLPQPRSVAALIERRLQQLSAPALALARVAALAGPDFGTDLAVHVLQVPLMTLADAWAELESAQVLREQAFAHDLIYEATLASVPAPIRRHARRAIAEFLVPRDAEPSRVAEHWLAAGEPAQAASHFVAAGRRAEAAARYAEAQVLFEQAARCHDAAGQAAQGLDTRLALADLLVEAGRHDAALQVLDPLAGQPTVDARLRVWMQQMQVVMRSDRMDEAIRIGREAISDEEVLEDATPHRLAEMRWTLMMALRDQGHLAEALAQLQLAEPALAASPDPSWRCWFHSQQAVLAQMQGEMGRANEAQALALAAARTVGRKRMLAGCLQNGATAATGTGHLVAALDLVDECLLLMTDTGGEDHFTIYVHVQRARLLVWLGRYREALDALEPAAGDDSPLSPDSRARANYTLAELWARLGQPARSRRTLAAAGQLALSDFEKRVLAQATCEVAWMLGEDEAASLGAMRGLVEGDAIATHIEVLRWRALPVRTAGPDAAMLRERWLARGLEGHVAVADALAARDAAQAGDPKAAALWAGRAHAALRKVLMPGIYRPWLHLEIARAALAADRELALRALRDGADWVHSVVRFQVPEPFRDSFLHSNRINRELLEMAAAEGADRSPGQ